MKGEGLIAVTVDKKISLYDVILEDSPAAVVKSSLDLPVSQVYVDASMQDTVFLTSAEDGSVRRIEHAEAGLIVLREIKDNKDTVWCVLRKGK